MPVCPSLHWYILKGICLTRLGGYPYYLILGCGIFLIQGSGMYQIILELGQLVSIQVWLILGKCSIITIHFHCHKNLLLEGYFPLYLLNSGCIWVRLAVHQAHLDMSFDILVTPGTIPPPSMNWVPHLDSNIQAYEKIPSFSLYDPSHPSRMVPYLKLSYNIQWVSI